MLAPVRARSNVSRTRNDIMNILQLPVVLIIHTVHYGARHYYSCAYILK